MTDSKAYFPIVSTRIAVILAQVTVLIAALYFVIVDMPQAQRITFEGN